MTGTPSRARRLLGGAALAVIAAALAAAGAQAQTPPPAAATDGPGPAAAALDPNVVQAGCSSCGGGYGGGGPLPGCNSCMGAGCDGPRCVPGRLECCEPCEACSMFGRFWCGLKGAFCCPDRCYQPCYIPAANSAFFVDAAKPVSQVRLRFDAGVGGSTMDRAEYFFGAWGTKGPPLNRFRRNGINYQEIVQTNEFAVDRFSFFMDTPYRAVNYEPRDAAGNGYGSGFGDLSLGTKSLLIDSEILLLATQFKTWIPIANFRKGLGTGHVSLEPSLLATLKVMPNTYVQMQLAQWIPIAGTPGFDGGVLHYRFALNHVLIKPTNDLQFIGSMEFVGYAFQDGLYTNAAAPARVNLPANDAGYFSLGPGFRLVFCQKYDIGFGMQFGVTNDNFARQLYRTEVRWRF